MPRDLWATADVALVPIGWGIIVSYCDLSILLNALQEDANLR